MLLQYCLYNYYYFFIHQNCAKFFRNNFKKKLIKKKNSEMKDYSFIVVITSKVFQIECQQSPNANTTVIRIITFNKCLAHTLSNVISRIQHPSPPLSAFMCVLYPRQNSRVEIFVHSLRAYAKAA